MRFTVHTFLQERCSSLQLEQCPPLQWNTTKAPRTPFGSTVALRRWFFSVLVEAKQCRLVPCRAGSSVSQSILTTQPQLSPLGNDEERQESDYHRFRAVQLNYFNLNINIESNRMFFLFHKHNIIKCKSLRRLLSSLNRFVEKMHKSG